jgi:hypothetical protein
MPEKAKTLSVNANTGAFVQLDAMGGPVFLYLTNNTGQAMDVVFGAADATAAAAARTANNYYLLSSGTTPISQISNFRCTPNQTWVRSNTATAVTTLAVALSW